MNGTLGNAAHHSWRRGVFLSITRSADAAHSARINTSLSDLNQGHRSLNNTFHATSSTLIRIGEAQSLTTHTRSLWFDSLGITLQVLPVSSASDCSRYLSRIMPTASQWTFGFLRGIKLIEQKASWKLSEDMNLRPGHRFSSMLSTYSVICGKPRAPSLTLPYSLGTKLNPINLSLSEISMGL